MFKNLLIGLFFICFFCCCAPTYPKENLVADIEQLIQKEAGVFPKVKIVEDTLYLDLEMNSIVSLQQDVVAAAINSLQSAVFAIIRVALSSDANIKIIVVSAYDSNFQVALKMLQNIEDVKGYFYQRISRGDYEQRQLIEMENPETAKTAIFDKHHITQEEFVARLVVSQLNMLGKNNPFIANIMTSLNLRYAYIDNNTVYLYSNADMEILSSEYIKKLIKDEFNKDIEKYKIYLTSTVILDKENNILLELLFD